MYIPTFYKINAYFTKVKYFKPVAGIKYNIIYVGYRQDTYIVDFITAKRPSIHIDQAESIDGCLHNKDQSLCVMT